MIKVTVVKEKRIRSIFSNILLFQLWVSQAIDKIPEEYKESTSINIYNREEGKDNYIIADIYYYKPETEEELLEKEKEETCFLMKKAAMLEYENKLREIEESYND